jgi:hypothetical protein
VPVEQGRRAVARRPEWHQGAGILRVVVEDAVVLHDSRREHLLELSAAVRAMGANGVEQGNVLTRDIGQVIGLWWRTDRYRLKSD